MGHTSNPITAVVRSKATDLTVWRGLHTVDRDIFSLPASGKPSVSNQHPPSLYSGYEFGMRELSVRLAHNSWRLR